jgi:AbrB family looped-hinge helix DNA binding protein
VDKNIGLGQLRTFFRVAMIKVKIDKYGRVHIPRDARKRLGLVPGSELSLRVKGRTMALTRTEAVAEEPGGDGVQAVLMPLQWHRLEEWQA